MMQEPMMNPNAADDFAKAIKEAGEKLCLDLGEQMEKNTDESKLIFIDFADMGKNYSGTIRLPYASSGAWDKMVHTLVMNGYRVEVVIEPLAIIDKVEVVIKFEEM